MEMDVEPARSNANIIALHGSRIPEMLGTFHLDDHNVQEWSDYNEPGMKHRARKEIGKWIDRDRNADIKFQRHEDSKRSETSREQQRTEVIQGNAPDAQFQIIRSQRQFQDSDDKSGARVTTMTTSYQMSSSRGIRSTSKTTSNKTTTKTVTVSGGRSDDFENLKMSFQPLDTSTQRERINVSRSGTMGVRRPPTRRHTPAAVPIPTILSSSSPDVLLQEEDGENNSNNIETHSHRHHVLVMNDESTTMTTGMSASETKNSSDPTSIAAGLKNISSKIRVGFPVEIQLELQSKLRYSNGDENGVIIHEQDDEDGGGGGDHPHNSIVDIKEVVDDDDDEEEDDEIIKETEKNARLVSSSTTSSTSTVLINKQSNLKSSVVGGGNDNGWHLHQPQDSKITKESQSGVNESAASLLLLRPSTTATTTTGYSNQGNKGNLTLDFTEEQSQPRRKSFGFETSSSNNNNHSNNTITTRSSILSSSKHPLDIKSVHEPRGSNDDINSSSTTSKPMTPLHERLASNIRRLSPSPSLSRSWDLIQSVANQQQERDERRKLFLSSSHLDNYKRNNNAGFKSPPQRSIVNLNPFEELDDSEFPPETHHRDLLESPRRSPERSAYGGSQGYLRSSDPFERPLTKVGSTPDIIHHNIELEPTSLSEKSRHLMTLLNETPDLLNKMSFKKTAENNNENQQNNQQKTRVHNDNNGKREDNEVDDNLSYINETISRLLEKNNNYNKNESTEDDNNNNNNNSKILHTDTDNLSTFTFGPTKGKTKILRGDQLLAKTYENEGIKMSTTTTLSEEEIVKKQTQVSHTWISSTDQKPSQRVRDNDVTTSISATSDPYRKAPKKVEFCKTEVHFTPDSGKFHIVETDENKPSTVHLFRRKKRERKNSNSSSSSPASSAATTSDSVKKLESVLNAKAEKISEKISQETTTTKKERQYLEITNNSSKKPFTNEGTTTTAGGSNTRNNLYHRNRTVDEDNDGTALELVRGSENAMVDRVGVSDGKKNSLFHHHPHPWSKQAEDDEEERAGDEELGIDEQTVTPTRITPGLNKILQEDTLSLNSNQHRDYQKILNFTFDQENTGQQKNQQEQQQQRRKSKESTLIEDALISSKGVISRTQQNAAHVEENNKQRTTARNRLLSQLLLHESERDKGDVGDGGGGEHINYAGAPVDDEDDEDDDEEDDDDDDGARSDDTTTLHSNYGELKIQRYLKQLKYNKNNNNSNSGRDYILPLDAVAQEELLLLRDVNVDVVGDEDGEEDEDDDDLGQFRYDSAYENGSFVPLATRRSLIEMNNRNRTKNKSNSHASDNSSTTSNYSLPLSDKDNNNKSSSISNNTNEYQPSSLKLKTMEAIIDTKSQKPQITSVDLRYGFSPHRDSSSYFNEPVKRNFKIKMQHDDDEAEGDSSNEPYDFVSEPVKPEIKSLPPFRSGRLALNPFTVNEDSEESAHGALKQKPPVPILPSHFSSFEKTGAALRERFNAKTTVRPKPDGREAPVSLTDGKPLLHSPSAYVPSKSIVNIGGDELPLVAPNVKIRIQSDSNHSISHDGRISRGGQHQDPDRILESSNNHHHVPEPILSMDHTWKGPAHFDNNHHLLHNGSNSKASSVARSLTFPKSSRPEPEWVAKAKSRESRVKDWNLIGKQQYGTTSRRSEPPWLTEIRFKSKLGRTSPSSEETKSMFVGSIVYPWEKERGPPPPPPPAEADIRVQSPETPSILEPPRSGHANVIITELPDNDTEIMMDHFVSRNSSGRDTFVAPPPKPARMSEDQRSRSVDREKDLVEAMDKKLMAPLVESSRRPSRKPLQTSSAANKSVNSSGRPASQEKPRAPPRPPKPPQRVSSLTNKSSSFTPASEKRIITSSSPSPDKRSLETGGSYSRSALTSDKKVVINGPTATHEKRASTPQKSHRSSHSNNGQSDQEDSIIITTKTIHSTPVHNHPLVKVAKIPSARSMHAAVPKTVASPEGKGGSKNKTKHHVVTTETKIACKSKLMDGQTTVKETEASSPRLVDQNRRPLPKVPPPRTPAVVSPHRNR